MATLEQIKTLREQTGVSVMQCKKALEEADEDFKKALALLKQQGAVIASKKADRALGSGVITSYVHSDNRIGVLLELLCETDFVARNKEFQTLADDLAMQVAAMRPQSVDGEHRLSRKSVESDGKALLDQQFIKDPATTVRQLIEQATQKFGEKVQIGRFVRYGLLEE